MLLVEDVDEVRALLVALLEAAGCFRVVGEAATVADGIDQLRALDPDVLLVDYKLPDGTGAHVAQAARVIAPDTYVALVTALGSECVRDALPDIDLLIDKAPTSASLVRQLIAGVSIADSTLERR